MADGEEKELRGKVATKGALEVYEGWKKEWN